MSFEARTAPSAVVRDRGLEIWMFFGGRWESRVDEKLLLLNFLKRSSNVEDRFEFRSGIFFWSNS